MIISISNLIATTIFHTLATKSHWVCTTFKINNFAQVWSFSFHCPINSLHTCWFASNFSDFFLYKCYIPTLLILQKRKLQRKRFYASAIQKSTQFHSIPVFLILIWVRAIMGTVQLTHFTVELIQRLKSVEFLILLLLNLLQEDRWNKLVLKDR